MYMSFCLSLYSSVCLSIYMAFLPLNFGKSLFVPYTNMPMQSAVIFMTVKCQFSEGKNKNCDFFLFFALAWVGGTL